MTRTIKLAAAAAMALAATSAFATNGDNLIGLGAKARGMGGVGIATSFGAESALANPALISSVKDNEIMFGGTLFMPSVEFGSNAYNNAMSAAMGSPMNAPITMESSQADKSVIPEVALASRLSNSVVIGIGMYGVAGMGTDYRDTLGLDGVSNNGSFGMRTNLQLMRFAVPVAYEVAGFSIGIAPMLQYGSLNIAYAMPADTDGDHMPDSTDYQGSGVSDTYGFGYEIGAAYDFSAIGVKGLTFGAKYQSAIDMEYDYTLSVASQAFNLSGIDDHLEQPAEIGVGISYNFFGGSTIAFDYKQVRWGDAKGYEEFNWENQDVFAVGYEYAAPTWAVRVGYNQASNPIKEQKAANFMTPGEYDGAVKNYFNMAGFPAVVESHFTIGGTYNLSKMVSVDAAFVYAPEVEESYDTSAMGQGLTYQAVYGMTGDQNQAGAAAMSTQNSTADVKHSQTGVSVALNYTF